jgi:lipopolysaccharide/colanic/teichoic acid biosynthesis glycosyltransferase
LFNVPKFRSLRPVDETESQTTWSVADDSRVGRWIASSRRTFLRGDMTLVGPRPERPHFVELFSAENTPYTQRHRVPAGLTLRSPAYGGHAPIPDRARFDDYYIEKRSLWLDLKVVLRALREVFLAGAITLFVLVGEHVRPAAGVS